MAKYNVRLTNEFSSITNATSRSRAGVTVPVGGSGVTVDLTPAQVEEIISDNYLTLHDPKTGEQVLGNAPVAPATSDDLSDMSFAALKTQASFLGVQNIGRYPSKVALIDAINAQKAATSTSTTAPVLTTTPVGDDSTDSDASDATPEAAADTATTNTPDDAPAASADATE